MTIKYIVEICVAIDIAILGIAYPIIVDKISNIGDRYNSNYLSVLFNKEIPQRPIILKLGKRRMELSIFQLVLYITIISFLLLMFPAQPPFDWNNIFIDNSAELLVLALTTILTILFFQWLNMLVLYNGKPTSLLSYVIKKYHSLKEESTDKPYFLKTINEFTFYAIDKQDEHLQETLLEFYYSEFSSIRKNHDKSEPLIYPFDLYAMVHKLNVQLANSNNLKLPAIEHRAVSGWWLLGEDFEEIKISEETYNWLWRNIYVIFDNEKFVKMYWSNAHQYLDFRLRSIEQDYDFQTGEVRNQNEVESRIEERKTFIEFHYALGGLLLYRNQYKTLKYIFNYSQSLPPQFVLLPDTMTEIFEWFEEFRNEFKNRKTPIDIKFYFPELDNLGNRGQVNYWICCYLTVLFLRQWTLHKHYTFQDFTSLPNLPKNVVELNNWLATVSFFENCLKDMLGNDELLSTLGYKDIIADKLQEINDFPKTLKEEITKKIGQEKLNAPLSDEKIQNFEIQSNQIISKAFENYDEIFIKLDNNEKDDELKLTVTGGQTLMSKSAFTDNDIPHLNYDSIFASRISKNNVKRFIPNSFLVSRTRRYLLNKDNILNGLDRLINKNPDIIIVAVNASYQLVEILKKYNSITKHIPSTEYRIQDTLYVLHKSDLPSIEHRDILEQEKTDSQLKLINDKLKIYTSIIDINSPENIKVKERWDSKEFNDNLEVQVQVTIAFLAIIYWRKDRDIVQIKLTSEFKEQGIQNTIEEIEPIKKNSKKEK
jgi:hypothetical protein